MSERPLPESRTPWLDAWGAVSGYAVALALCGFPAPRLQYVRGGDSDAGQADLLS